MLRTLKISFSLRNTYRVNSILYSIKQIPLIKKVIPASVYGIRGFKIFANILSILWEIISVFCWKMLYVGAMIFAPGILFSGLNSQDLFLHILFFLTVIGTFLNTNLFNPTQDKYYAIVLMRMDARKFTLVSYGYYILKLLVGFLPALLLFGLLSDVPKWICLLLPAGIAGMKLFAAGMTLMSYRRRGKTYNENLPERYQWVTAIILLVLAYGLPFLKMTLPSYASIALFAVSILLGIFGAYQVITFPDYVMVNKELLYGVANPSSEVTMESINKENLENKISTDGTISSSKSGYEYLNELFIKRHRKILWNSTKRISVGVIAAVAAVVLLNIFLPETRETAHSFLLERLPYFLFIMYIMNRGTGFTQALFLNCDHSLLTYSFYKQPKQILKLFRIRLREIMKINAVPALLLGCGLALILFTSGGTDHPLDYLVLIVSILCMSLFFSVHYLTIYYLLQPYNAGTEIKSGTYQLVTWVTYFVCFMGMRIESIPMTLFALLTIGFVVLYAVIACILVYRLAPKTFRIRN